ncbi:hypothetical protein PVAND_013498 [Polypedilum vanderplanki]|uniref:Ionotropic receptor n=1 Tax=Polypedilum vanderplanki TaxID=319348 RepID=A0A9J6CRL1_POLVA|nr:hypothetical protein PVAND_013498 [Polypedilum vanderplanki]
MKFSFLKNFNKKLLEGIENFAFPISYSIFLLILIFVPCVHGSNIEEQSKKFIRDLFACDWHQADINDQKMIAIMMENLKKPMSVCGFGFGEINLEFFLNFCNSTKLLEVINKFENGHWQSETFYPKLKNFHKCQLKLGTLPSQPATDRKVYKNGTVEYFGSDIKIVTELEKTFNFTKNVSIFQKNHGEVYINGTADYLIKDLIDGHIDFICAWYFLNAVKAVRMDFTQPYYFIPLIVNISPGIPYSSIENLLRTFSSALWVAFILSTLMITVIVFFINKITKKTFEFHQILIIILGEGTDCKFWSKSSLRPIIVSFAILCVTLRAAYVSKMFDYFKSDDTKIVRSLKEMQERNIELFIPEYLTTYIGDFDAFYDKKLIRITEHHEEYLEKLRDYNFQAGIIFPLDDLARVSKNYTYYILPKPLSYIPVVMYFKKNSYLIKPFSDKIQIMLSAGLIDYWIKIEENCKDVKPQKEAKPMSLEQLSASFYICICGLLLATICFICELINHKINKN